MAFSQQVDLRGYTGTKKDKELRDTVRQISNKTGMKKSEVLRAKTLLENGGSSSAKYKDKVNSLAEGEQRTERYIDAKLKSVSKRK